MSFYNLRLAVAIALGLLYIYISLLQNPSQLKNMYFISLFLVIKLLALYFVKYGLNHLSIYPVKNNPAYATWSTTKGNFTLLCLDRKSVV